MKKLLIVVLTVLALTECNVAAKEPKIENELLDDYISIYGEALGEGIAAVCDMDIDEMIPNFSAEDLLADVASGKRIFSVKGLLEKMLTLLLIEIKRTVKLLIFIPALAVLNSYLTGVQEGFRLKGATKAMFFTCYCIMAGIAAAAFVETVGCGEKVIKNVSVFMRVIIPVALVSLATSGATVSASVFETVLMSVIEITQAAVEKLFLPLVMMGTALNIANNVSGGLNVEKLVQLINKSVKWGLGVMLTLFVGITGLQGIAAGSTDGLTVKLTKFAASNLIPLVGGILSETVETVMNCSVVIKNSVGVAGIILVIAVAIIPILKIAACLILFRLCAALIQPISDDKAVKCISELGNSVSTVFSMSVAVVVMFVIILTMLINMGNSAVILGR